MATSTGTTPPTGDAGMRTRDKVRLIVEGFGLVVAILAVIVAIVQSGKANVAQTNITSLQETNNNYAASNTSLQAAYDSATSANAVQNSQDSQSIAQLSAQLATATAATTVKVTPNTTSPTAPSFTTSAVAPTTRNPNPFTLRPGSPHIDLDSTVSNWATDPTNEAGADLSFYSPEDRLAMGYGTLMSLLGTTPANYDNCRASYSAMSSGEEFISKFKVGDNVCVFTGEMRYVAMVVTSVTGGISFNATSYDPPGR